MIPPIGKIPILFSFEDGGFWIHLHSYYDDFPDDFILLYLDDYLSDLDIDNYINWRFINNDLFL